MAHAHPSEFSLADDYDTALHIVESIRRKAQAQHNQRHADRDSDDDDDEARASVSSDDLSDDGDNNDSDVGSNSKVGARRRLEAQLGSPQVASPQPPSSERASALKSHRALEALRIEPYVELHRIASGRNLRLKHISQTSKGALSPHALTPRAPSGRRPTERPSSWSSSSSSSSSLARHMEAGRVDFYRPHTHRASSVGGGSPLLHAASRSPATAAVSFGAMGHEVKSDMRSKLEARTTQIPPARQQVSRAPAAQDRRSSFTISELALKEMGFSRSSPPGPETAPIHEDKQFVVDPFARFRASPQSEISALVRETQAERQQEEEREEEVEEKAVYQFALWKKAGRSRQLPDAISTRSKAHQEQEEHAPNVAAAASLSPEAMSWRRPSQQQQQKRSPSAMFSDLRVDSGMFSPEAFRNSSDAVRAKSESPALRLPLSRSPTISVTRGSRSFRRAADSPSFASTGPEHR